MTVEERQAVVDEEHLKILAVGYWISTALDALFSLLGVAYMVMGVGMAAFIGKLPMKPGEQPPPAFLGWFFSAIGFGIFGLLAGLAILKGIAARRLHERRSRIYCMVIAAVSCLSIPYGTLLGIFTFMVLGRPSVSAQFDRR